MIENKLKTLPLRGKVTDCFCSENGDVLVAASGQAFGSVTRHVTSTSRPTKPRMQHGALSQAVEVDEAFQVAKGLFFGLKQKLNERIKSTQPVVKKLSSGVKDIASNVTDRISKEIFDDEIFINDSESGSEARQNHSAKVFDVAIQDEPVQFQRHIKTKVKRKHESAVENKASEREAEKNQPTTTKSSQSTALSEDDVVNINNAIMRACLKSDQNDTPLEAVEIASRPQLSHVWPESEQFGEIGSSPIEIVAKESPSSYEQCSSGNNSWIVVEEEPLYDQI